MITSNATPSEHYVDKGILLLLSPPLILDILRGITGVSQPF